METDVTCVIDKIPNEELSAPVKRKFCIATDGGIPAHQPRPSVSMLSVYQRHFTKSSLHISLDSPKRHILSMTCASSAIHPHPHHHQGTYGRCVDRTTVASAQKGTGDAEGMGGLCFNTVPISNLDCCRGEPTDLGRRQEPTTPHSNAPLSLSICLSVYPAIDNLCV